MIHENLFRADLSLESELQHEPPASVHLRKPWFVEAPLMSTSTALSPWRTSTREGQKWTRTSRHVNSVTRRKLQWFCRAYPVGGDAFPILHRASASRPLRSKGRVVGEAQAHVAIHYGKLRGKIAMHEWRVDLFSHRHLVRCRQQPYHPRKPPCPFCDLFPA